ncbi:MAG: hypothetical protein R2853_15705 [Thermomicrobiales bacterium]
MAHQAFSTTLETQGESRRPNFAARRCVELIPERPAALAVTRVRAEIGVVTPVLSREQRTGSPLLAQQVGEPGQW